MPNPAPSGSERRRYVRMDTVFPVEMVLRHPSRPDPSAHFQGFTHDVSLGGLRVEFNALPDAEAVLLQTRQSALELTIHAPFRIESIRMRGHVVWMGQKERDGRIAHLVGVEYDEIGSRAARSIVHYAQMRRIMPRILYGTILLLIAVALGLLLTQFRLVSENRRLVRSIVQNAQGREPLISDLEKMASQQKKLALELRALKERQATAAREMQAEGVPQPAVDELQKELDAALMRESDLQNQLTLIRQESAQRRATLSAPSSAAAAGQTREEILSQLTSWLERHANAQTGLLPSYEGDPKLEGESYTYDQALSVIAFSLFKKNDPARKILTFYRDRAKRTDGGFLNAYDTFNGEPIEWTVHTGPNVWIGIAALQYERLTGDAAFAGMARSIGDFLIGLQAQDPERGLRGGPGTDWFSTEHNLDAYAFFGMLHRSTGDARYQAAQEEIYQWLIKHAADRSTGAFKRGKGDATIATDTFSWSLAAIGPARLAEAAFDPEGIMEFAEEHCRAEVDFARPDGRTVRITGFDFSKVRNAGRGGVVSSEWTAQAVVTFGVLERHFAASGQADKAAYYRDKIDFYLNELQKMIISSPSRVGQGRGCLPYATAADVDTGHGWRTPGGDRTGSVAGTAYGIFAWKDFNPFDDRSN